MRSTLRSPSAARPRGNTERGTRHAPHCQGATPVSMQETRANRQSTGKKPQATHYDSQRLAGPASPRATTNGCSKVAARLENCDQRHPKNNGAIRPNPRATQHTTHAQHTCDQLNAPSREENTLT